MSVVAAVGATGNIGRELVSRLVESPDEVRALVRDEARARDVLGSDVELVVGDMSDPTALARLMTGADRAFVVSSSPGMEVKVIDAAAKADVGHVVKSSALARGTEPPEMHASVEAHLRASGMRWTVLRPSAFMQTLADYLPGLIAGDRVLRLPAGDGRTGFVDVRDIAAVAFAALTEPGHEEAVHVVTGPEALTMSDVAEQWSRATGQPVRYQDSSPADAVQAAADAGLPSGFASFLVLHYTSVKNGAFDLVTDTVGRVGGAPARTFAALAAERARPSG